MIYLKPINLKNKITAPRKMLNNLKFRIQNKIFKNNNKPSSNNNHSERLHIILTQDINYFLK